MGERELIGLAGLVVLGVLLALRIPVALAMVTVGIAGNYALSLAVPYLRFDPYLKQFKTLLWGSVANYELSVVPLFILMGFVASRAGLSRDLFDGFNALFGRVRGGVAMASVGACAAFGAVCGSSIATASTMGRVALPELKRLRYADRLATGTLAAGGTLGILIPPSIALVIYAIIVEASIISMFQAALLPGVLAVGAFVFVIFISVRWRPALAPRATDMAPSQRTLALRRMVPVLVIFALVIAGLGFGLFTPTPAAAVGAGLITLYAFMQKPRADRPSMTVRRLGMATLDTAVTAGMIYFIVFGAEVLKGFFTRTGLPAAFADWATASGLDPWSLLVLFLLGLIVLGCIMDSLAMILVAVPFFWPVMVALNGGDGVAAGASAYGMDNEALKLWFGILALVVVELGLITPPVGLNVFVIASLARGVETRDVFLGVLPFFFAEFVRVAVLLLVPGLCLWLPLFMSSG